MNLADRNDDQAHREGGYGWLCAVCSFLINMHAWCINSCFSGATALQFSFVDGLSFSMSMFVSPLATIAVGKSEFHTSLSVDTFVQTLAFVLASFTRRYWELLLSQGIYFGVGKWFTTRRSLANGLADAGSGLGGLHMSAAWTLRILGIISGAVNLVSTLLIRDRSELGYVVLLYSLPNFAAFESMTAQRGFLTGALVCLGTRVGRCLVGYFSDKFATMTVTCTSALLTGLWALVIWPFGKSFGALVLFALFGGLTAGTYWATAAPLCAKVVGIRELNSALSISFFNLVLPPTFSEAIALEIAANTGNYLRTQPFTGLSYVVSALCLWFVKAWKIGALDR
ncbi:MFS general substrate transporter [Rhizodiscina lignyota]|uniref:MFS general substrate transporter n=1 Tax=Rhizodiscina lignyota TaxID=1504668 RepID=A0A9P4IHP2_9PEZI|nr:MFS general substrate transporter [Rhizodiscina lignyota]